jgi:hypothetical protein
VCSSDLYQRGTQGLQKGYDAAMQAQQPYYQVGTQAMQDYAAKNAAGGFQDTSQFDFDYQADPGYQARLQAGAQQQQTQASAGGSQLSGATQQALARYNQNFASNEYGNAYNRAREAFESNRAANIQQLQAQAGRYQGLAGLGQNAAMAQGQYGMQYGNTLANLGYNTGA